MIKKILIANRGEIALRIIKTAKKLNIKTVAIYSPVDSNALFVKNADAAYQLPGNASSESYLDIKTILEIAKLSGADSIHPGYGFLSENADFAMECLKRELIWIGPNPKAMHALGSKKYAKKILAKINVPLIPGYHEDDQDPKHMLEQAKKIGFPIMLKAANGGGGRGMRAVHHEKDFKQNLDAVKREALAYFADEEVIIEKLLINPRHIEVQVLGDKHGNVITLFDRDCSMQRRQQKIIEEAPAYNLPVELHNAMQQTAIQIATNIGYDNAGTIEFLVAQNKHYYFMEMNTRLQVEHPVTEMVTGVDLVELQIKIAQGESISENFKINGHAIECRICAEDPKNNFLPVTGKITQLTIPKYDNLRVDSGITIGDTISPYYDSMIAKIIVWDKTRQLALQKLEQVLSEIIIGGIATNLYYLKKLIADAKFQQGEYNTDFISNFSYQPNLDLNLAFTAVAIFEYQKVYQQNVKDGFSNLSWRLNENVGSWYINILLNADKINLRITPLDCNNFELIIANLDPVVIKVTDQGPINVYETDLGWNCFLPDGVVSLHRLGFDSKTEVYREQDLKAPMAATVVKIHKPQGAKVVQGEPLIILEAMKMEHVICSPISGKLKELFICEGQQVSLGMQLADVESQS
jgi:3-methylcrotonyl-CoA carboxylase alpha subunit